MNIDLVENIATTIDFENITLYLLQSLWLTGRKSQFDCEQTYTRKSISRFAVKVKEKKRKQKY